MDCPYRGDPLIKVLKCSGDDDQGAEFQDINLKDVFDKLSASVEGCVLKGRLAGRDKKDIVKKYESLEIFGDDETLQKSCENEELSSSSTQEEVDKVKKFEN